MKLVLPLVALFVAAIANLATAIPEDVEVLDGFSFQEPGPVIQAIEPETEHFLTQFLIKAIRNKRSPRYKILESEGLRSHFRTSGRTYGNEMRTKRSVDEEVAKEEVVTSETLPNAEKLVQNGYYGDEWSKYNAKKEEMDTQAEASAINEGIKARAPRVNFITQNQNQREAKSLDVSESRDTRASLLPETTTPDYYRRNLARMYLDYPRPYDSYARPYEYDRNYVDRMGGGIYPEYYDTRRTFDDYDSYMPRTLSYPNYYYYPDKRYDVPEPRDPYLLPNQGGYTNEIPPLSPVNRNRRIIYYTTLPEVVRTPPNVNLNLKGRYGLDQPYPYERVDRSYYPPAPYNNYYNYNMQTPAPAASYNYPQSEAYRSGRAPRDYIRPGISSIVPIKEQPRFSQVAPQSSGSTQNKVKSNKTSRSSDSNKDTGNSSSLNNQNSTPDRRMFTEVKDTRSSYQQDGSEDRGHYFSRNH